LPLAHPAVVLRGVPVNQRAARHDDARAPTPLHERDAEAQGDAIGQGYAARSRRYVLPVGWMVNSALSSLERRAHEGVLLSLLWPQHPAECAVTRPGKPGRMLPLVAA